jgi:hypothetical protein
MNFAPFHCPNRNFKSVTKLQGVLAEIISEIAQAGFLELVYYIWGVCAIDSLRTNLPLI